MDQRAAPKKPDQLGITTNTIIIDAADKDLQINSLPNSLMT
ncbi:hypothetical protein SAMN05444161_2902 [Rhizobiales bacterium GAS191]|nr:hypothetical protein SAMN05444161_2902 [Rhizobiales bacterium GAS191]